MSTYPGMTCKDAHWVSFFTILDVAPLNNKDSSEESDSDGDLEPYTYIGLSIIVPTIQSSLHMFVGGHASSTKLEFAGLFNCLCPKP